MDLHPLCDWWLRQTHTHYTTHILTSKLTEEITQVKSSIVRTTIFQVNECQWAYIINRKYPLCKPYYKQTVKSLHRAVPLASDVTASSGHTDWLGHMKCIDNLKFVISKISVVWMDSAFCLKSSQVTSSYMWYVRMKWNMNMIF